MFAQAKRTIYTGPLKLRVLMDAGVAVETHSQLHAKVWIGDDRIVEGSANASADGLGLEGSELTRWIELCHETSDPKIIDNAKTWFEYLWSRSHSV
jgi:hypothetical protein